jgi:enamine deaminase RidA (YjgF/YER057c/UK114 family)
MKISSTWLALLLLGGTFAIGTPMFSQTPAPTVPLALRAETAKLDFVVPRPAAGTIDEQVQTQLDAIVRRATPGRIVKLRFFAVGSAALTHTAELLRADLARRHVRLPVMSAVGVAAFPSSDQQVQIEGTLELPAVRNPNGLAFLAGVASPTGERTAAALERIAAAAGVSSGAVRRVSCFYEDRSQGDSTVAAIAAHFPSAEAAFVQSRVETGRPAVECEAVARLARRPSPSVHYVNLTSIPPSPNYSHAVLVGAHDLVFTSGEIVGTDDRLMNDSFARVERATTALGASLTNVVMGDNYWLTDSARDVVRRVRARYYGGIVPAATGVFFTALADTSAMVSTELVLAVGRQRADTVVVRPGSPLVNGAYLTPHTATVAQTITSRDKPPQKTEWIADKRTPAGPPARFELSLTPVDSIVGRSPSTIATLDRRTLALVSREDLAPDGARTRIQVSDARVSATTLRAGVTDTVRFTLPEPAFHASFVDAVLNGMQLREGLVVRIPTFSLSEGRGSIVWHTLRVAGRDSIALDARSAAAWVVEEFGPEAGVSRRLWLVREPPFFPLEMRFRADGSVVRIEQRVR